MKAHYRGCAKDCNTLAREEVDDDTERKPDVGKSKPRKDERGNSVLMTRQYKFTQDFCGTNKSLNM